MFLMFDAWPMDVERYLSSNPGWLHSGRKKAVVAGNRTQEDKYFSTICKYIIGCATDRSSQKNGTVLVFFRRVGLGLVKNYQ